MLIFQVKIWNLKFDKIGSIYKTSSGKNEVGFLADGTGDAFETATEYYKAWATKNKSKAGATSDLVSRIEAAATIISKHRKTLPINTPGLCTAQRHGRRPIQHPRHNRLGRRFCRTRRTRSPTNSSTYTGHHIHSLF